MKTWSKEEYEKEYFDNWNKIKSCQDCKFVTDNMRCNWLYWNQCLLALPPYLTITPRENTLDIGCCYPFILHTDFGEDCKVFEAKQG